MERDVHRLLKVLKLSAQIMLENGGETYRVEETIQYMGQSLGVQEIESFAIPTGIYITVSIDGEDHQTIIKRINKRRVHLERIHQVNTISRQISEHGITLEEAEERLEGILNAPEQKQLQLLMYGGMTTAFFTALFGGSLFDFGVSFIIGLLIVLVNRKFDALHSQHFASNLVNGGVIALVAAGSTALFDMGSFQAIILGAMMPQLPGLAMINAIRDTIRGDFVSGVARVAEVILISASLAIGSGVVMSFAYRYHWGI